MPNFGVQLMLNRESAEAIFATLATALHDNHLIQDNLNNDQWFYIQQLYDYLEKFLNGELIEKEFEYKND